MTTPDTLNGILSRLRERISGAEGDAERSHKAAMNSYGAGYDRGFADALKEVLTEITDEA